MHGNLLCSTFANPLVEFPLSLPKKINNLDPDDFTICSIQTNDRVKAGKDVIPSMDSREAPEGVI